MPDGSSVRVNLRASEFEVSGTEAFVEKMIEKLHGLMPSPTPDVDSSAQDEPDDAEDEGIASGKRKRVESLEDFVEQYGVEDVKVGTTRVLAMVYYLTKIKKQAGCVVAEIRAAFNDSGVDEPENISQLLTNMKGAGTVSKTPAGYKTRTKGADIIKALLKRD